MPNRHGQDDDYRYGFNGLEKDNEINGDNNSYSTQLRQYDPRIARWTATDPYNQFASPYVGMGNNPMNGTDIDGGWWFKLHESTAHKNMRQREGYVTSAKVVHMNIPAAMIARDNHWFNFVPRMGLVLATSTLAMKHQDPSVGLSGSDVAGVIMAGAFKWTRGTIRSLNRGLKKADQIGRAGWVALGINEKASELLIAIVGNSEYTESFIEQEVMRNFNGKVSEGGNTIGIFYSRDKKGWSQSFGFSNAFVDELESKYLGEYMSALDKIEDKSLQKEFMAGKEDWITSKVDSHLKKMFEDEKAKITEEVKSGLDKLEEYGNEEE